MPPWLSPTAARYCPCTAVSSGSAHGLLAPGIPGSPPLSESTIPSTLCCGDCFSKAHTYPLQAHLPLQICFPMGCFCFIVTTCLHFLNCPGFFLQLGEQNPPPFPFRFLFLYLELSAKNSPWGRCFYCCCIFLSCHFIPHKMQVPPPVPPVLTSGQCFLPFLITISLTCYDSTQNHWH